MAVNLWYNGSMEEDIVEGGGWIGFQSGAVVQSTDQAWDQTNSLKVTPASDMTSGCASEQHLYIVEAETQYTVSCYIYPEESHDYTIVVDDQGGTKIDEVDTGALTADTWTRVSLTVTTGVGDYGIRIRILKNADANTDVFYVDGVMVETGSSASTWVDFIQENLWANADFETAVDDWSGPAVTCTKSSTEAWEQTYSMRVEPTTAPTAGARSEVKYAVEGSTRYTVSVYLFPTSGTMTLQWQVEDQDSNYIGSVGAQVYPVDEWTRIQLVFDTGADDTGIELLMRKGSGAETAYFYMDAVQLEKHYAATSWVNSASGPTEVEQDPVGTMVLTGFNPIVGAATGQWEIGPYIYDVLNEVKVLPTLGTMVLQGHNPTVGATGAGAPVTPTLGMMVLAGLNPTVGATKTRADRKPIWELQSTWRKW